MTIEWVVGIGVASLLLGVLIGYFMPQGGSKKARVAELETALETAQEELQDYKSDVFGQFAETAEKFRALDKSYNDLHRQLAQSSVALCGDAATPLLENQSAEALSQDVQSDLSAEAEEVTEQAELAPEADDAAGIVVGESDVGEAESGSTSDSEPQVAASAEAPKDAEFDAEDTDEDAAEAVAEAKDVALETAESVPTLTEVDEDKQKQSA